MPQLPPIRNFNLKVIFLVHYVFISLSSMGDWVSSAYIFYNFVLILLLLWGIYREQSHDPVQLAIVVNGCAIILDIFLFVMRFPESSSAKERLSAAMAILHLLVRPFSMIILIKNLDERSGSTGTLTGILSGHRSESYEDIDRPNVPQPTNNPVGYDFSTAQQI